tara:strand:- start:1662 stop:1949 length:288 start_codon:yes stop_codon:yes gene_type:complete
MSQLSEETLQKLADTLVDDVIDYINDDDRLKDFYLELIGDAVCEKLGNKNSDGTCTFDGSISADLIIAIADRIRISKINDTEARDILSYFKNKKY